MPNKIAQIFLGVSLIISLAAVTQAAEAADQPNAEKKFESFCRDWLQLKNDFAARKMQLKKADQGYIAEYDGYSDNFSTEVKVSDPVKNVYVGILGYKEVKLQHEGKTKEDAKKGPFNAVIKSPVKEIFLYRNGKWLD